MENTITTLAKLVDGNIKFDEFLKLEDEIAQSMQLQSYTKPTIHEEIPISTLCMNLYQAIKAANYKHSNEVLIKNFYQNPLCEYWLEKAKAFIQVSS